MFGRSLYLSEAVFQILTLLDGLLFREQLIPGQPLYLFHCNVDSHSSVCFP